jgi:hypothetical protein
MDKIIRRKILYKDKMPIFPLKMKMKSQACKKGQTLNTAKGKLSILCTLEWIY